MSDTDQNEPHDDLELDPETVEDLDADDSDADVKGGGKVQSKICNG